MNLLGVMGRLARVDPFQCGRPADRVDYNAGGPPRVFLEGDAGPEGEKRPGGPVRFSAGADAGGSNLKSEKKRPSEATGAGARQRLERRAENRISVAQLALREARSRVFY